MHNRLAFALAAVATTAAASASAVVAPTDRLMGFEHADGSPARATRVVSDRAPRQADRAWRAFSSDVGGRWRATWDDATGVPSRIFGSGLPAPDAIASGVAAERAARAVLTRHLALLAPGAHPSDFELAANVVHDGQRVVSFYQQAGGMRVLGGQLSFRFKNDRLFVIASEALPHVRARTPKALAPESLLRGSAASWVAAALPGAALTTGAVEGPFVLPLVAPGGVAGYRVVMRVTVDSAAPRSRLAVYLDAASAVPVAREQLLRFATGSVLYNAPVRQPTDLRNDYPARFAQVLVDGNPAPVDQSGVVTFPDGAPVQVTALLDGPFVSVDNDAGPNASQIFTLDPGGTLVWNAASEPQIDAQLNSFIHAQIAKDHAAVLSPALASYLDDQLPVNVNINDVCNAFYDGQAINFFRESGPCENTGRLPDVVYHEFGHWFHHHSLIAGAGEFDSALSEGASDYYAASITGDPAMGRGFFYSSAPLRHIDPPAGEYVWPDDIDGDPHQTGLIIGGALWDLRKLLVAELGEMEGAQLTDALFAESLKTAADIPSMYVEMLAADDDDGNLDNGTPHVCAIAEAFGAHGLRTLDVQTSDLAVAPPEQDGYEVSIHVDGLYAECPSDAIAGADIVWRLRRLDEDENTVSMSGGGGDFSGTIPSQSAGEVVEYRVELSLASGGTLSFPNNPADPMYQLYVGEVTPIYCTDFESDPDLDGWTHGLSSGAAQEGADDWQWGEPNGTPQNGDPVEAYSGTKIFGNDLGHGEFNGLYQSDKVNYAYSPVLDVGTFPVVRLQFRRWLSVEDGTFDSARIYANDKVVWKNFASPGDDGSTHHQDREWRFHDVDLTAQVSAEDTVQVRFEIASDGGLEMGGWSIDDFCIVGTEGSPSLYPDCGNGALEVGEACDDGNTADGDGCSSSCVDENGAVPGPTPPLEVGGCGCRTAGPAPLNRWLWLAATLGLALGARRRSFRRSVAGRRSRASRRAGTARD